MTTSTPQNLKPVGETANRWSGSAVDRARELLRDLIELSGISRREVERRLLEQDCGTDLGRLLSGRLDLKLRHVLDIVRVLELDPGEFFGMVFKKSAARSPFLRRLESIIGPVDVPPRAQPAIDERTADGIAEIRGLVLDLARTVDQLKADVKRVRLRQP
jgi:hypothetical protein